MYPGHHFNNLSIKLGITSISALKEAVDHTTLDTAALRIKFAEQLRLVKALSSMNEEHADEVLINSTKYKVAQKATAQGKYAPVQGDEGPGQVFMYKSENQPSEKGSRRSSAASSRRLFDTPWPNPSHMYDARATCGNVGAWNAGVNER